jgi:hypothetical protein
MFYFAHEKKQLEVKPAEIAKYLGASTDKAKANVRKTMERMQKSNDLVNGKSYGTYSILSKLPSHSH